MTPGKRASMIKVALALVAVQAALFGAYRLVADKQGAGEDAPFRYETLPRRSAPMVRFRRPDGSVSSLEALRGKPVLLHFWATWCPPCKEELPALLSLGRELAADGAMHTVAITFDKSWAAPRAFLGGDLPAEIVADADGTAVRDYELSTLPDTYLIDADGFVRARFGGARDWRSTSAREALRALLDPGRARRDP